MEKHLLREKEVVPTVDILKKELGDLYPVYEHLIDVVSSDAFSLEHQWNWYNDGKAWLCKVTFKKKTILWLSLWEGYFKTGFYFASRHSDKIYQLDISPGLLEDFRNSKPIGKLIPMIVDVSCREQIDDVIKLINFKKGLS